MEDIVLIHRRTNKKIETPFSTFSTCLRQIVFVPSKHELTQTNLALLPEDQFLEGAHATSFLIEILCGLHSPLIGETEVFGQFKKFFDEQFEARCQSIPGLHKWMQFVFQQVKNIRSQHLTNLGSTCYGSLARRFLKSQQQVNFFGSGQLAKEIAPWLSEIQTLRVFCRDPQKVQEEWSSLKNTNLVFESYAGRSQVNGALIIAAPMSDRCILSEILRHDLHPSVILDLRSQREKEFSRLPIDLPSLYVDLETFFSNFKENQEKNLALLENVKLDIFERSQNYFLRADLRPLGWDDICA